MIKQGNYYFSNLQLKDTKVVLSMPIELIGFNKYSDCLEFCKNNGVSYNIYHKKNGILMLKKRVYKKKVIKETKHITPAERAERLMLVRKRRDETEFFTNTDIKRLADLNFKLFKDR